MKQKNKYEFRIENVKFKSFNDYNNMHWATKKKFKDELRLKVDQDTNFIELNSGYDLSFEFYFKKRVYDTVNVFHMIKIIEDKLFKQDNKNGTICVSTNKSDLNFNYIILKLKKIV